MKVLLFLAAGLLASACGRNAQDASGSDAGAAEQQARTPPPSARRATRPARPSRPGAAKGAPQPESEDGIGNSMQTCQDLIEHLLFVSKTTARALPRDLVELTVLPACLQDYTEGQVRCVMAARTQPEVFECGIEPVRPGEGEGTARKKNAVPLATCQKMGAHLLELNKKSKSEKLHPEYAKQLIDRMFVTPCTSEYSDEQVRCVLAARTEDAAFECGI